MQILANTIVINPIIYAECTIGYNTIEEIETLFELLGFQIQNFPREVLFLTGKVFVQYRQNKGNQTNVLPDFLLVRAQPLVATLW